MSAERGRIVDGVTLLGRGRLSTDEDLQRWEMYRKSFATAVDLRAGEDLAIAVAAGIHPSGSASTHWNWITPWVR